MPMAARFSLLLGASCPTTRLGTMAADSAAIAAVDVNCLRETVRVESSRMRESSMGTGSHTATGSSCYTGSDAPVAGSSTVAPIPPAYHSWWRTVTGAIVTALIAGSRVAHLSSLDTGTLASLVRHCSHSCRSWL